TLFQHWAAPTRVRPPVEHQRGPGHVLRTPPALRPQRAGPAQLAATGGAGARLAPPAVDQGRGIAHRRPVVLPPQLGSPDAELFGELAPCLSPDDRPGPLAPVSRVSRCAPDAEGWGPSSRRCPGAFRRPGAARWRVEAGARSVAASLMRVDPVAYHQPL